MTTTMALAAISFVGPETTSLDTMPVTRMATKLAWKAGWVPSVTKVCVHVLVGVPSPEGLLLLLSQGFCCRFLFQAGWDFCLLLGLTHEDAEC
jgi:hypothetical protein